MQQKERLSSFIKEIKPTKAILMPEQKVKNWDDELLEKVGYI